MDIAKIKQTIYLCKVTLTYTENEKDHGNIYYQ